jgi:hypothetical protein
MGICPHTGITIPECSCPSCLEAQWRQHKRTMQAFQIALNRDGGGSGREGSGARSA